MMPGRSGIEILKEVRASKKVAISEISVIMITAKSQVADIDEALDAGATSYIVKPFRAEALIEKVQTLLPVPVKINAIKES
jgi:DNA-binding response OmpR family regulator